jgi:hypothetical protein
MLDMLTLADLYDLHSKLAATIAVMLGKLTAQLNLIDTPGGIPHWTLEGTAIQAECNVRLESIRELRDLMTEVYTEIQRREHEARPNWCPDGIPGCTIKHARHADA